MVWKEVEGLRYLKIVFGEKNDVTRLLKQSLVIYEIPIIVLPKVPNKSPLELLVQNQLRIQSLTGPIETKFVYEYLLKFGPITDFLILDSFTNPTTFLATFSNDSSKNRLASCHPDNMITFSDEKKLKIELNIKPALIIRKSIKQMIVYQLNENKYVDLIRLSETKSSQSGYGEARDCYGQ